MERTNAAVRWTAGLFAALAMGAALAQEAWPSRPVTIVVPFGPGSGTDVATRMLGQKLGEALGHPIVVANRPGAQGSIAAESVSRAKPDGYTLLMGTNSTHGANPGLIREMRYDPIKGFEAVTRVAVFTSIVATHAALPARTMQELIALGRSRQLSLATGNASGIVMGETLARRVGWTVLRVPFKSNPDAMTDVIAGRVDFMFTDIAAASGQLRAGTLRPLAVTSRSRSALMPDLPTLHEAGVTDYDLSGWIALFAPAGTPRPVVERLNAEVARALQHPDVRKALNDLGAEPSPMPSAEFAEWVQQEVVKWTRLVREAGIQPD
jgi:tripartite-type tricarboxylate transporter receptor subunit TctC